MKVRLLHITLIVMVFILALSGVVLAAEDGNGTIEGKLTNGTAGGGSVADHEVALKTYRNDAELSSATARTDAEGRFVFQELATSPDYSYQVTLIYQQAEYIGDRISFGAGEASESVEMTVYDATTSDEALKVTTAHTIVYVEQGILRVSEYLMVDNDSDHAYIGSRELSPGVRETLVFAMPAQATGLQAGTGLMSCCIYNNEGGFVDSMVVLPGTKELAYSYDIAYKGEDYVFSRNVSYPTANYDLLIQSPNVQVTGNRLSQVEPVTMQDIQFNRFSGADLALGDVVTAQISGLSKPANQSTLLWVLLVMAVLVSGFVFSYIRRQRRPQPVRVSHARQEESLFAELARLDDEFEGGKIAEENYRRVRAQKKMQLTKLTQKTSEEKRGNK